MLRGSEQGAEPFRTKTKPKMTIDVIDHPSSLSRLREAWLELEEVDGASVVAGWDFASTWCRRRLGSDRIHVLAFRRGSECVGIAPLMVAPRKMGPLRIPTILYMTRNGFVPGVRVISRPDCAADVARAMLEYLLHRDRAWSVIRLNNISPEGALDLAIREGEREQGLLVHHEAPECAATIEVEESWEKLFARFREDRRRTVRKKNKDLEEVGEVSNRCITDPGAVSTALETCFDIAARSWQGRAGTCIGASEVSRDFYRDLFESFARTQRARIQILSLDDRPISFEVALGNRGCHHSLKIGFDAAYRSFAPGILTVAAALRSAVERGDRRAELFHPATRSKLSWGVTATPSLHATLFTSSLTGRLLHAARGGRSTDPVAATPA